MNKEIAGLTLTETIYDPNFIIDEHSHESPFFCLILKGEYSEVYESRTRHCRPLSLVFHPANEIHSNRIHESGTLEFQIEFGPDWERRIPDHDVLKEAAEFTRGELPIVAMQIYREFQVADDISNLAIEALMLELIVLTLRARRRCEENGKPEWLVRIEKLIHEQFTERLTVNELAGRVHVHPAHLAAEFRKHYRCSVGNYVRDLRISRACQHLTASDKSLSQMALDVGFYDQSHFSKAFKKAMGVTPAQYRRQGP